MNSFASKYFVISAMLTVIGFVVPPVAVAGFGFANTATIEGDFAVLRVSTWNTSANDRGVIQTMGARGNRFTGPGYSKVSPWFDQPLDADFVVVVDENFNSATGQHCVTGNHRWVVGTITHVRTSPKRCVANACAINSPEASLLSLSGERATLTADPLSPLTRRGIAEDSRSIVLDEYALVRQGPRRASFQQVSANFQVTPSMISALTPRLSSDVVPPQAGAVSLETTERQLLDVDASARSDRKHLRSRSQPALLIQHQREHPANERFAPLPQITFTPQVLGSNPSTQGLRGFAIVDFGASGRILHADAISESAEPAGAAIVAAISGGISTEFADGRRHDHRVYLAYEIDRGVLRAAGSPFVTMPMCCPCPPPPPGGHPDC
jgi:hypothetical protein